MGPTKSRGRKPVPVRIVHDGPSEPYRPKDATHMSVRQIENGYIVNRHGYRNGKHFDEDIYTPTAPKIDIPGRSSTRGAAPSRADRLRDRKI